MSIDKLHNSVRKLKNSSMVLFTLDSQQIPPAFLEAASGTANAYGLYAKQLLSALKGIVPAVRFAFGSFALYGQEGMEVLKELMAQSTDAGYYVLLDAPQLYSPLDADLAAELLDKNWQCDGVHISCYLGSDGVKPFAERMKSNEMDLFVTLRTGNKSASELQDLLAGSRLVYAAAADLLMRTGEGLMGKCGYSRLAGVGPATSADALRTLRGKNENMYILIDGYDYSGANAKNCSYAFDKLGHGAIACAGKSVVAAWADEDCQIQDPVMAAVEAAERMKKNLNRYISIL